MTVRFTSLRTILAGLLLFGAQACSRDAPEPTASSNTIELNKNALIATTKSWFDQASKPTSSINGEKSRVDQASEAIINIDWEKARGVDNWVVTPLSNTVNPFPNSGRNAYRYLVNQIRTDNTCTGSIVEIVAEQHSLTTEQATNTALATLKKIHTGQPLFELGEFTGWMIFYSPTYEYQTSLVYKAGKLQAEQVRLKRLLKASTVTAKVGAGGTMTTNLMDGEYTCTYETHCGYAGSYASTCQTTEFCQSGSGGGGSDDSGGTGGTGGTGDNGGVGWGGGGNGGTPTGSGTPRSFNIDTSLAPCAKKVATDIITLFNANMAIGGPIANLINTIGANPNLKINITQGAIQDKDGKPVDATTTQNSLTEYTITINTSTLAGNTRATDLSIARNIIHEFLHVYMFDWASKKALPVNAGLDGAMQDWFRYHQAMTVEDQHAIMSTMVSYMGQSLSSYYNNTYYSNNRVSPISDFPINDRYFTDLCWQGVFKDGLDSADRYRIGIVNKIENERFSGPLTLVQGQDPINVAPAGKDDCQ
ncbi:MAG: hypothetical protein EOP45_06085 [Sphingobacteriaceae bacterium]|nr:MAG: hypothetical protein EOP45_06085 [Sphingobacteriaceae bacterium]